LPDKAIDLIDEAGARLRLSILSAPPELREFDDKIAAVRAEKEAAIEDQDFELAAAKRDEEKRLLGERLRLEKQWRSATWPHPAPSTRASSPRCSRTRP